MVKRSRSAAAATTFGALGHPVRTAIVEQLAGGRARVTDLARSQPMSLAAVSKHITVLERAGIVRRHVDGRDHWLSLDPRPLDTARHWLALDAAFWSGRMAALGDLVEEAAENVERSA